MAVQKVDMSVDLGFFRLTNPVLTASGTFGYGIEMMPFVELKKLGGVVTKGLYFEPREGNPPPRLVEVTAGLLNAIGLPGIGVKAFIRDILPRLREEKATVIVNVCGETVEEYVKVVRCLDEAEGIAFYELNISCPNVEEEGCCPALNPQATYSVVSRVKKAAQRPIVTKLSPNVTDIALIARAAEEAGSDALSLVNTFLGLAVNVETRRPKLANVYGGLSGPAIKPLALRLVYQTVQAVNIPVIGLGGIVTGYDALEFLSVGARAVQIGTANFFDPQATLRIIQEMEEFCREHNISRIEDFIGSFRI
ncbi:MAG: dihydroorotate dehydrogenase B catalytic subunit [Candidatus Aminicenantes bacterium 4484_214]|nr:dihydroorotate dehydrogenase [Candidatus Aminicenantes bacterium]OQX52720.1 MAG: dihydroorotate dehydrogenase B catalytic subunit [Candidatus Aminicenantes bacterium 4484_214]